MQEVMVSSLADAAAFVLSFGTLSTFVIHVYAYKACSFFCHDSSPLLWLHEKESLAIGYKVLLAAAYNALCFVTIVRLFAAT